MELSNCDTGLDPAPGRSKDETSSHTLLPLHRDLFPSKRRIPEQPQAGGRRRCLPGKRWVRKQHAARRKLNAGVVASRARAVRSPAAPATISRIGRATDRVHWTRSERLLDAASSLGTALHERSAEARQICSGLGRSHTGTTALRNSPEQNAKLLDLVRMELCFTGMDLARSTILAKADKPSCLKRQQCFGAQATRTVQSSTSSSIRTMLRANES